MSTHRRRRRIATAQVCPLPHRRRGNWQQNRHLSPISLPVDGRHRRDEPLRYHARMLHELPELAERGYVVLGRCDLEIPQGEYLDLEYRDWRSGGDTNFAPIASAFGAVECAGFWD